MQNSAVIQNEIDHILFELKCCVNDLQGYLLQISTDDIQQAELSMHKLQTLISFVKLFSQRKTAWLNDLTSHFRITENYLLYADSSLLCGSIINNRRTL